MMLLCSQLYCVLYNFTAGEKEFSRVVLLNPQIEQNKYEMVNDHLLFILMES